VPGLILPVDCVLGQTCFVQSLPDIDPGAGVSDPICGKASYDGHKGIDIRLFTLDEIAEDVGVLASASGKVKNVRDGMADILVSSERDRQAVAGRECGNGVVIDHGNGLETQYCHMKRGSIRVVQNQHVETGTRLGSIGTSGLSQFPHLHLSTRLAGQWFDPLTGKKPGDPCGLGDRSAPSLFNAKVTAKLLKADGQLLAFGFTGTQFATGSLLQDGPPPLLRKGDDLVLAWAHFLNLKQDDRIVFQIQGPGDFDLEQLSKPLERHKATYTGFAGRRRPSEKGTYRMEVSLMRQGKAILTHSAETTLE